MNIIQIYGNLGSDPDVRTTPDGTKVTTLNVASNSRKKGQEVTTWFRCTIWGNQFDRMMEYLKKGSSVIVFGEMRKPEIFTGRDGTPQVSVDVRVDMLKFSPFGRAQQEGAGGVQQGQAQGQATGFQPQDPAAAAPAQAPAAGPSPIGFEAPQAPAAPAAPADATFGGQDQGQGGGDKLPF